MNTGIRDHLLITIVTIVALIFSAGLVEMTAHEAFMEIAGVLLVSLLLFIFVTLKGDFDA